MADQHQGAQRKGLLKKIKKPYDYKVTLTQREREIVDLLRLDPLLDAAALADRLGTTKASVAVHLSNLAKKGVILGRGYVLQPDRRSVVVVGGANMDIKAHSREPAVLRTSNPGAAVTTPGGVGRNIAENLARMGSPTHLVAPVGRDSFGEELMEATRGSGVVVDHMVTTADPTGTYLAVMDADGELLVAVSNMSCTDNLTVRQLAGARDLIAHCDLLVVEGNIPPAPAVWLLDYAAACRVPVVVDPVSVAKAAALAPALSPERPLLALTPNKDELAAIVGRAVPHTTPSVAKAAREVHDLGVRHVWVRRGLAGSTLSSLDDDGRVHVTHLPAPRTAVVDVTGAGDSMTAAFVHALLRGDSAADAAAFGQMAAALTVASPDTVRPDISARLVDAELRAAKENA
jgi:pseudouridine kinase